MDTVFYSQDFLTLALALVVLSKHVEGELSRARQRSSTSVKQLAIVNMRQQIENVRAKLQTMEGAR